MRFLKKASYQDIIGKTVEHRFHYYENLSSKYKEFELFLNMSDLKKLLDDDSEFNKLIDILKKNGAVISAIHCPESCFKTCNEGEGESSSNYLSLCEVVNHDKSKELFEKVITLANKISVNQSESNDADNEDDEDENEYKSSPKYEKEIIVILHEGCTKGCVINAVEVANDCKLDAKNIAGIISSLVNEMDKSTIIKIALENITPFYSTKSTIENGRNCGWNHENQKSKKDFFEEINNKLKEEGIKNIAFGACVDFCHIMVSPKIMQNEIMQNEIMQKQIRKSDALNEYFNGIDYSEYIYLFHVSNYGEDLSHGTLFSFENEEDKEALETIKNLCNQYAPRAPITFEMADGTDREKAILNYEHIMFYFSNKHLFGKFGELLSEDVNKDLKKFFDDLFVIYTYDKKAVYEITNSLWRVKKFILKNTYAKNTEERLFGVDFDKTNVDLSLVRLKAYVYYARFCNLGNFLAENYYSGDKCIWDNNENIAEDFGLAMKYFIFNDQIHQCVYTGIQYKFLVDFLPKKETFFRFNDGITTVSKMKIEDNPFREVVNDGVVSKIPGHVSGNSISIIKDGKKADFYSCGKNFVQCLFKYFDSSKEDWSLRIYENMPINYVDYNGKRYSIQAFTQLVLTNAEFVFKDKESIIDLSLDISRFASGRDGNGTDSLEGFIKYFGNNQGLTKETVASTSDEEILFTKLPDTPSNYQLDWLDGVNLKIMCLAMVGKKDKLPNQLKFIDGIDKNKLQRMIADLQDPQIKKIDDLEKKIENINNVIKNEKSEKSAVGEIFSKVKENVTNSEMAREKIEALEPYENTTDKKRYNDFKNYISFNKRGY